MLVVKRVPSDGSMASAEVTITGDTHDHFAEAYGVSSLTELNAESQRRTYEVIRSFDVLSGGSTITELVEDEGSMIVDTDELGPELAAMILPDRDPVALDPDYAPVHFILRVFSEEASADYMALMQRMADGDSTSPTEDFSTIEHHISAAQTLIDTVLEPPSLA